MISSSFSERDNNSIESILNQSDIHSLNQIQFNAIHDGLLEDQNFLLTLPTGSGKTILSIIKSEGIIRRNQRIIYLTPTRVLNNQIYNEFRSYYSHTYYIQGKMKPSRVNEALKNYQVLVSTFEKFEIELKKNHEFLDDVGLVIIDELHLISDRYRGPSYEFMITLLLYLQQSDIWDGQILGMSGSIHNPAVIASWMNAGYSHFDKRMNLDQTYVVDTNLETKELLLYSKKKNQTDFRTDTISLTDYFELNLDKLILNIPEKYISIILTCLNLIRSQRKLLILCPTQAETEFLNRALLKLIDTLQWSKINSLFHHASTSNTHKENVEMLCREGVVDCIFTTTTFAMGVDFPFEAVILTFQSLFDRLYNWKDDTINEKKIQTTSQILLLQQIIGRAGHRPGLSATVYCVGETLSEGFEIYQNAIEATPGLVSNFNSYFGKIKFLQMINDGFTTGYFTKLQDILDFSKLTLFSVVQRTLETKFVDENSHIEMENFVYNEIINYLINPLLSIRVDGEHLENKILNLTYTLEEVDLKKVELIQSKKLQSLTELNISPKQIADFLEEFDYMYSNELLSVENIIAIVKLIVKTDPKLIIEMRSMSRSYGVANTEDKEIRNLNKLFSPLRKIDYYLTNDLSTIRPSESEISVLKRINNLVFGFQNAICSEIKEPYLFSKTTHDAFPSLQTLLSSASKRIDKIINLNS